MSTAHSHDHAVAAHDADAHPFDGEPAHALPADEPPTPLWLPVLGLALFALVGTAFLGFSGGSDAPAETAPAAVKNTAEETRRAGLKPPPAGGSETQPIPAGLQQLFPHGMPGTPAPGAAAPGAAVPGVGAPGIAPGGAPSANLRKLTPEEVDAMRKRLRDSQAKPGAQPQPAPARPK